MTKPFLNNYSLKVSDADRSVKFYQELFGMTLVHKRSDSGKTYYTLGLTGPNSLYQTAHYYNRGGLLELTHEAGANPDNFKVSNGNVEPFRGFGHICFSVSDLPKVCETLEAQGCQFKKKMSDGRQKNIAFALDPDGYWIELIENQGEDGVSRLNHSMIRVKDKDLSLKFYTEKLGMTLVDISDHPNAKFTLFFLSFDPENVKNTSRALTEGLVELTYNWDTEKEEKFIYYNGNDAQAKGFNYFTVAVKDPASYVEKLQSQGIPLKSQEGSCYIVSDPDDYFIKIVPQAEY